MHVRGKKTPLPENAEDGIPFDLRQATNVLSALSHSSRYEMVCLLRDREWSSLSLSQAIGVSPAVGSQHLVMLKAAGIVSTRRVAQTIYYSLRAREILAILDVLCHV